METFYNIHDEKKQRKHFDAITNNEWLSGSVRQIKDYSKIYPSFFLF